MIRKDIFKEVDPDVIRKRIPDYCSSLSASRHLAENLQKYWHQRGRPEVRFWVERDTTFRKPLFVVRSNLRFKV